MSSPTLAPRRSRGWFVLKIVGIVALVLLVAAGSTVLWFDVLAHRALPQLDGTVHVAGLSAPVTVIRDQQGVPHITAANMQDLLFAQGFVTAQDRFWEMDMTRRYGNGDLAEILGSAYVESDRVQRILGLREVAKRAATEMSPVERALADAYARGVNAYLDSAGGRLPMEFRLLHYVPSPWTVEDSLVCGATFSEMLNLGYANYMITRERVESKVPPEIAADLYPTSSWRDHPPMQTEAAIQVEPELPDPDVLQRKLEREERKTKKPGIGSRPSALGSRDLQSSPTPSKSEIRNQKSEMVLVFPEVRKPFPDSRRPLAESPFVPGSNNWVVSGAHTATGKPLLSNDMHLQHHIPNVWYEVQLTAGDFDVAGVSAPGIPFVIEGHNRRVAWGFTNLNPASMDVYVETFNAKGEYQTPSGWQKPQSRHEVINVKGAAPVEFDVLSTRHGPIVSSIAPGGDSRPLALRWVLYEPHALAVDVFHEIDSTSDWTSFRQALSHFATPGQNVVYADVDGHIGYQATGWVPVRKKGDATRPVPGNTDEYEWNGYLTLDQMPHVFDPESGIIATANNKIVPDGYPYLVGNDWFAPMRVDRIYRVLHQNKKFSAADMLALQTDIYSSFDQFLANQFVYAVDHSTKATARAKDAANVMRGWDGRVTIDAAAPTIALSARVKLERILLQSVLSDDWKLYGGGMREVWLENTVLHKPARWLPKQYANWNDLLADAVDKGTNDPAATKNIADWKWGKEMPLYLQHPVFGMVPLLDRWSGPGLVPQSGNGNTVKQVGRTFGPSQRFTADLSDLDRSTMNIVTGEGGNLFSPYFMDQWQAWYRGTTYSLPFSNTAVSAARAHDLRLVP
ncbi:MAG: penicillin acylase family protein [Terriglobales bacterium]